MALRRSGERPKLPACNLAGSLASGAPGGAGAGTALGPRLRARSGRQRIAPRSRAWRNALGYGSVSPQISDDSAHFVISLRHLDLL
jgi:hypothetical protein